MARRLPVFLLVLFFVCSVLANETDIEEKAKKLIRKNANKKQVVESSESESDVKDRRKAKNVISLVQKERKMKKEAKSVEKNIKNGLNSLAELKRSTIGSESTEKSLKTRANAIARKQASQTVVRINDLDGNVVAVKVIDLERAGSSAAPIAEVSTDKGALVRVSTARARSLARQSLKGLRHSAVAQVEQELVERASGSQEDMDRLINLLFKRIVRDHDKISQRKAFARVEDMMSLKQGTLYTQYHAGVKTPTVPEKDTNDLLSKTASKEIVYGIINQMDLVKEQEMPETVRLMINKTLREEKLEEEKEKNTKPTWKEFLFGK